VTRLFWGVDVGVAAVTVKVGSNAGENTGCMGEIVGCGVDDGNRGFPWFIGRLGSGMACCVDGGDVIEPDALEGTDGKGKLGGGFFAGSPRRNLKFQASTQRLTNKIGGHIVLFAEAYLELAFGFAGARDMSGSSPVDNIGRCCGREGESNMFCILAATSAALTGVLMPASGEAVDDVKDDLIFLRGESWANRPRREGEKVRAGFDGTWRRWCCAGTGARLT